MAHIVLDSFDGAEGRSVVLYYCVLCWGPVDI